MKVIKLNTDDLDEEFCQKELPFLDSAKRERAQRYRNSSDRKCCITGDYALRLLVSEEAGCRPSDVRISADPKGCPYILHPASSGLFCSVSHSGNHVVAAVSEKPVGIDIERISCIDFSLAEHICSDREMMFIKEHGDAGFCRIWTAKEAYLKCIGTGITDISDMRSVDTLELPEGFTCDVDESISGYIVSVVRISP